MKNCYEDLAVQKEDICFDDDYSVLDLESSHKLKRLGKFDATKPFTDCELKSCIQQLKTGKSTNEFGLCAAHLKTSGQGIIPILRDIFNDILHT